MVDYTSLLSRLAERSHEDLPDEPLPAPLPAARIEFAEQQLGFQLHPLLRAVYGGFANGGFGPDEQLLSLVDGPTSELAVDRYLTVRAENAGGPWAWPEGVLPILTWGCGMYACVDCRSDAGTVLLFEPNPGIPEEAWYVDSESLQEWFEHYLDDDGWWNKLEYGEETDDLPPWPHAAVRGAH